MPALVFGGLALPPADDPRVNMRIALARLRPWVIGIGGALGLLGVVYVVAKAATAFAGPQQGHRRRRRGA